MVSTRSRHGAPFEGVPAEQWYASQAAADFLGIHRSTLHLAVRRMKLTPDAYTPGGHARFKRDTLERFSERLALESATGGDGSMARALAGAVASLSHFTALEPVCEAVVDAALTACPSFEGCMVVAYDDASPRGSFQLLASRGVPKQLADEYRWLRRRPGLEFITSTAARQGASFLCSDVQEDSAVPDGGRKALLSAGWRSCGVLPCVSDGQTLGLLICLGRVPCGFNEPEVAALTNLADVVTVALRRWRRDQATQRQSETIAALMRAAQAVGARTAGEEEIAVLRRICQQGSRAKLVCEWGISAAEGETPAPLANILRAAARGAPQRAEWSDGDGATVALAAPASTSHGQGAVGAIWRRQDMRSGMELALLQVYAQVCSEVVSR